MAGGRRRIEKRNPVTPGSAAGTGRTAKHTGRADGVHEQAIGATVAREHRIPPRRAVEDLRCLRHRVHATSIALTAHGRYPHLAIKF
jgi:hypothetical protein